MEASRQLETFLRQHESSTCVERTKTHVLGEEAQQTQKSRLSLRHYLREVLEAALALSAILVIGAFLPPFWFQSHLIFCVVFLLIFVIAVRYHAVTTYTVGLLVAGCYSWLLWRQSQANLSFAMLQIFIEPFLLFVCGIVISEMLRMRQRQLEIAGRQHVQKEDFLQELKQRYQATRRLNIELERQLVGRAVSVSTLSEKMACLWGVQGQEQYDVILDIVMYAMNAKFCALYMLHNGRMSLCASKKLESSKYITTVRLKLDVKDALIRRTIQSRQVCTVRDTLTDSRSTQKVVALMAGPLVDQRNQLIGVIIVDDIPLLKFLPTTVHLFTSLLYMISMAMQTVVPAADPQ
jgi:K+-sensing histidine kinase KdpD